jgi:hypothetical protein
MVEKKKKGGRFANLARQARGEEDTPVPEPEVSSTESTTEISASPEQKKRGRPSGRRSDPDYTQISAYIPLELLHEVQDLLLQERRRKKLRSGIDVSGLVEDLLKEWVKRKRSE